MIKKITIIAGALLAVVGSLGFVAPNLMGMHLSDGPCILYLFSGGAALYFGLAGRPAACSVFCILFGSFYAFLGATGIGLGGPRLTIVPGQLAFETLDHLFHLILGAVVLTAGLSGRMAAPIPALIETKRFVRIFQHPNQRAETPDGLMPATKGETAVNKHSKN